jgi:biotin synthase-like enzyme
MKKSKGTKTKVSGSKKHEQSKKHDEKKERRKVLKVAEGIKKEGSLLPQVAFESFPILGTDSTAVQEITFLFEEGEKKDPEFKEVNEWLKKIGEETGGEENEEPGE